MAPAVLGPRLLLALDLVGTFVFAVEGATTAIAARLDPLGVLVLAFATALAGGLIRDLLIGSVPPGCIGDGRYAAVALAGGAVVMLWHGLIQEVPASLVIGLDAAGLGLFAMAGVDKALAHRMPALIAILMGAITGAGGGTVRDLLLSEVPRVLRTDIYAVAALAGATVMVAALRLRVPPTVCTLAGAAFCFGLRMTAVWRGWSLPIPW